MGLANAVSIAKLFIYVRVITIEEFGNYATLSLLTMVFIMVGSLGFITELQRRLPIELRRSNHSTSTILIAQVVLITFFVFAVCTSVIYLAPIRILNLDNNLACLGLFGGLTQLLFSIVSSQTRARLKLTQFSKEIFLKNLITLVGGVGLATFAPQAKHIFLFESVLLLLYTAGLYTRFSVDIRSIGGYNLLRITWKETKSYRWTPVFSMFVIGFLVFINQNIERYLAKYYLSVDRFAIISFGLIVPYIANMIQSILNSSIFTTQVLEFQDHNDKRKLILYSLKVSLIAGAFFLLISVPSFFIARASILYYYPQYSTLVPYLHLVFLAFAIRSSDFISNVYTIINKPQVSVLINTLYLVVAFSVLWTFNEIGIVNFQGPSVYFILNLLNGLLPPTIILIVSYIYSGKAFSVKA
jgi:hypothetical protein